MWRGCGVTLNAHYEMFEAVPHYTVHSWPVLCGLPVQPCCWVTQCIVKGNGRATEHVLCVNVFVVRTSSVC